uniref:ZP domain-containing protein n=1 Tax=Setaria digitata TaxID=48799 RepID=A0A915PNF5_9BILA
MMTTEELHRQTQMPVCRYEILSGSSKGQPIRYAKVGDSVYHRWTCLAETEDLYCMRVHTCTVSDGQGGEAVEVLDSKGCSVDKYLLLDLEYTDDLTAGRESHVFKFADRPALYFNCQLQLTTKDRYNGCRNEHPICTSQSQIRVEPSEQTYEQAAPAEKTITSSYQTNNKEQNYPTPADADYKSNELPYQSNEVVYPSPPGPPAPPTGTISSRVHLPSKSVYSADSNYEDITTVSHKEEYSQTLLDSYGPVQETTTFYEEEFAYKRLIRRRRNSTKRSPFTTIATSLHVVDVDLPEQRLMVFDIEDDHPLLTNREMQSGNLDRLLNPMKDSRTCFSSGVQLI